MVRVFSHYISARLVVLLVLEALVLMIAIHAGLWFHQSASEAAFAGAVAEVPLPATAFGLGMLMIMNSMGLYQPGALADAPSAIARVIAAVLIGLAITFIILRLVPSFHIGIDGLVVAVLVALAGSGFVRFCFYRWSNVVPFKPRVLVLGNGPGVKRLAEFAQRDRTHVMVCHVPLPRGGEHAPAPGQRLLPIVPGEALPVLVDKYAIDHIVITVKDRRGGALPVQELLECRLRGVRVSELPTFFEREHRQVLLESLNPSWMVFGEGFRQGVFRTIVKRLFDIVVSLTVLILALPVMLVTALLIAAENGMPILYRQERVGQYGRVFTIYKFRSMRNGAESDGTPRWAGANDDRTTAVGRIIRKLRIDELPQVFNVLKGEMTFVGPRPERPFFVDQLAQQIPYYALRHSVKPGITGWAQVRYPYGASVDDAIEKLQYDLYYVKNHSLFLDLVILFATVEVVLWGSGSGGRPAQPEAQAAAAPALPAASLDPK